MIFNAHLITVALVIQRSHVFTLEKAKFQDTLSNNLQINI